MYDSQSRAIRADLSEQFPTGGDEIPAGDSQVVAQRDVCESLRLRPGQRFQVFDEDGQILLVPVVPMKRARGFARGIDTDRL